MTRTLSALASALALLCVGAWGGARPQASEAAQRLFADAERLQQEGDLEASVRNYELLVQQFAQSELADDALLRVATGRWSLGAVAAARDAIERLKNDYPRSSGAAGAFVLDGDIRAATADGGADLEAAREAYRSVILLYGRDAYPRLDLRALAHVRAGEISVLLGEPAAAASSFLAAIEDEPHSTWTDSARLQLASVLMRAGDWEPAAEILQRVRAGAGAGEGPVDPTVDAAGRRLALGYRLLLRPALGETPWTATRRLRISGPELKDPVGVAASEDGRVIVVDPGIPLVAIVGADGALTDRVPSSDSYHAWWDRSDSTAHVATKKSVLMPTSRQRQQFLVPDDNEMKPVEDIISGARGAFRQWILLDADRKELYLFDERANFRSVLVGSNDREPADVVTDHRGRLYVVDRKAETVTRFAADGSAPTRIVSGDWDRPEALAVDALGNVYVLDRDAKTIEVFDPEGELRWRLGPQLPGGIELKSPRDLSVDGSGRIYIADKDLKAILVVE